MTQTELLSGQLEVVKPQIASAMQEDGVKSFVITCENGEVNFFVMKDNIVNDREFLKKEIERLKKQNSEMLADIKKMISNAKQK